MPNLDHETIEFAFIVVAGLAVLLQTIILFAIYRGVSKATQSLKEEAEDLRSSVMPVVDSTRELLTRLGRMGPKVEQSVTDLAEFARALRAQAADVESSAKEILERVNRQTNRVDAMASSALDAVDRAGVFVTEAVSKPVRQISGLLASARAIIESLRSYNPPQRGTRLLGDKDTFV
jgi:methyl-accepting chemotaxis protein